MSRERLLLLLLLLALAGLLVFCFAEPLWRPLWTAMSGGRDRATVVAGIEADVLERRPQWRDRAGWQELALIAYKDEQRLALHLRRNDVWQHLLDWPFTATSGELGPKLREGDRQIPEGRYRITALNPNSSYHLSVRLDYPNDFDRRMGVQDGRTELGSDIYIHGRAVTIGCIPIGDPAIEELFWLVDRMGMERVRVLIVPTDLRRVGASVSGSGPEWLPELYAALRTALVEVLGAPG